MDVSAITDTLTTLVPGASFDVGTSIDMPTVYVPADRLVETCLALRDTPALGFNVLVEITAADYFPRDPRFEVVYHLLSIPNRSRLRLKVRVPDNGSVPTVQSGLGRGGVAGEGSLGHVRHSDRRPSATCAGC